MRSSPKISAASRAMRSRTAPTTASGTTANAAAPSATRSTFTATVRKTARAKFAAPIRASRAGCTTSSSAVRPAKHPVLAVRSSRSVTWGTRSARRALALPIPACQRVTARASSETESHGAQTAVHARCKKPLKTGGNSEARRLHFAERPCPNFAFFFFFFFFFRWSGSSGVRRLALPEWCFASPR